MSFGVQDTGFGGGSSGPPPDLTPYALIGYVNALAILSGGFILPNSISSLLLQSASVSGNIIAQPAIAGPNISGFPNNINLYYNGLGGWSVPPAGLAFIPPNSITNSMLESAAISGNVIASFAIQQGNVLSGYVDLNTYQVVSGEKIFYRLKVSGDPIVPMDVATKNYVDTHSSIIGANSISGNLIASPGISQGNVLNGFVDLVSNQVVSGTKTFYNIKVAGNPINPNDVASKSYVDSNSSSNGASISGLYIIAGVGSSSLPYARILTPGSNVSIIDNGPGGTLVISASVSGSSGGGSSNSYFPSGW